MWRHVDWMLRILKWWSTMIFLEAQMVWRIVWSLVSFSVSNCDIFSFFSRTHRLDMGFEPQIRTIIAKIPTVRQSMMFTATWPREVQSLAREFLINPVEIKFGDLNNLNANKDITQVMKVVSEEDKAETLLALLMYSTLPRNLKYCQDFHLCVAKIFLWWFGEQVVECRLLSGCSSRRQTTIPTYQSDWSVQAISIAIVGGYRCGGNSIAAINRIGEENDQTERKLIFFASLKYLKILIKWLNGTT